MPHQRRRSRNTTSNQQPNVLWLPILIGGLLLLGVLLTGKAPAYLIYERQFITLGILAGIGVVLAWQGARVAALLKFLHRTIADIFFGVFYPVFPVSHDTDSKRYFPEHKPQSAPAPEVPLSTTVAEDAMSRAGWSFQTHNLSLNDIGLLVYRDAKAHIHRTAVIPTSAKYIRPFVVMQVPRGVQVEELTDYGRIRFNLTDWQGVLRFTDYKLYPLKPGPNFLTSDTWLPIASESGEALDIQDNRFDGEWDLQVLAGEEVLAEHSFRWRHVHEPEGFPLIADGEMNKQTRAWLDDTSDGVVSLADLMAEQAQSIK